MNPDLYRVASVLADGRKVYFSKRGRVHLVSRAEADLALVVSARNGADVAGDPCVYAVDLDRYGSRSLFLEALEPFVMVVYTGVEPASDPIDPAAFILGGGLASEAGRFSRTGG